MKSTGRGADVVIAGAGIAGIATAYQLALKHGVTDIVLVDPRPPLTLTSEKSGANYRDWWPRRPMVDLVRRSIVQMREMRAAGAPFGMNRRGYLYVTTDPALSASHHALTAPYQAAGIEPIRIHEAHPSSGSYRSTSDETLDEPLEGADVLLDRSLIRESFPYLSGDVTAAIHVRNAGSIDVVALGHHMLAEAKRRGVQVLRGEIGEVECRGGRVNQVIVKTAQGLHHVTTRIFVNAAGPFAKRVADFLGISLPLVNVLQQKVTIPDPLRVMPGAAPFTILLPDGIHIKPDGSIDDPVVKLGWAFNVESSEPCWEPLVSSDFPRVVLMGAARIVPGLAAYAHKLSAPISHEAGFYVKTPDDLPLIGPLDVEGAHIVTGLAGFGGMAACAVGEIAAAWITATRRPPMAAAFSPDRFVDPAYVTALAHSTKPSGAL